MAFCPSRKELLAFAQIGISILAFLNYYETDLFDTPMYDIRVFEHQCVSISLGFMALYYGLGTWFWYSNVAKTRIMSRIHSIIVYVTLICLLYITRARYTENYGPFIRGVFDHGIFDDEDVRMATSMLLLQFMLLLVGIYVVVQINYILGRVRILWNKGNHFRDN